MEINAKEDQHRYINSETKLAVDCLSDVSMKCGHP